MSPCIGVVRKSVEDSLTRLFKEVPNLRIGMGANGDYCDKNSTYVTTWSGLTSDIHRLCRFVREVKNTNGGDLPECYELVLREAQELDWRHNAKKVLVLVADDVPHAPYDLQNVRHNGKGLDWRKEADALAAMGVVVYAVQCLSKGSHASSFYRELAERTGGYHFLLDQFSEVTDLLTAICLKQGGREQLKRLEEEIEDSGRMTRTLDASFAWLSDRPVSSRFSRAPRSLEVVPPGRFQILSVDDDIPIREFVEENSLVFKKGRGFYQFTKAETIQGYKEVVLRDKATGDMYSGKTARKMIGLSEGKTARIRPAALEDFDVFVQSTSVNRKLIGGTQFLYEVDLDR
ncbi:VWA domain-containing protein [Candidatus Jorgensenbacteria bacterium]|nr:VWA domain-containing protein [Candidatus Jorgensenbacteria bacterium]